MPLLPLQGHAAARAAVSRAVRNAALPQSILLHGPTGIGKERFGLWLAQLLLCGGPASEPCDQCHVCRLVLALQHPDLHWFFPLPRPDATSPEKLREKLQELRAAELGARRSNPLHIPSFDRPPAHYLAAVQLLQQLAAHRPAMGAHKVFVIGDAELMVPQEASQEAANAFLKLLEEPPPDTTLILTTERPGALLPTIRSRVLPIRLRPLHAEDVATVLIAGGAAPEPEAYRVAAAAQGSVGRAVRLLPGDAGPGVLERHRQSARLLLEVALSSSAVPRLAAAHAAAPAGGRGDFVAVLDALAEWLRDLLALAADGEDQLLEPGAQRFLRASIQTARIRPAAAARALQRLDPARKSAEGNVNPQLILTDLLRRMQSDLATTPERPAASAPPGRPHADR
jgi:DNA polymerase III subunit delta'